MQWYYVKDGERLGPFSQSGFLAQVRQGGITDDTLVWNETMADWSAYKDVPDSLGAVLESAKGVGESSCSMCGRRFDSDEMIEFEGKSVCADCKTTFVQQIRENAVVTGKTILRYAGFWRRFAAAFIDGIVIYIVTLPIAFLFGLLTPFMGDNAAFMVVWMVVLQIIQMLLPALYMILMHGKYGATLGKKALGIKVVRSDGRSITYGRATGRYFAYILSAMILYIGFIMAGFDSEKRALHDHMCDTRVVFV